MPVANDCEASNCKLSGNLCVGSSGRSFSSSSMDVKRGPTVIGLSAVFYSVLEVFLVIFGSEAVEGMPFCF